MLTSVQFKAASIRSGVLMLALLSDDKLGRLARNASKELAKIQVEPLFVRARCGPARCSE